MRRRIIAVLVAFAMPALAQPKEGWHHKCDYDQVMQTRTCMVGRAILEKGGNALFAITFVGKDLTVLIVGDLDKDTPPSVVTAARLDGGTPLAGDPMTGLTQQQIAAVIAGLAEGRSLFARWDARTVTVDAAGFAAALKAARAELAKPKP